jgi:3-oxoacyl-[acyl-carrier protein] reductase
MNLDLSNKTAIVCGSTQGIGRASAIELALLGANITLLARNEQKLKETLAQLPKQANQTHHYIVADFGNPTSLKETIEKYLQTKPEVHILINNTGGPAGGNIIDESAEKFQAVFAQHLVCNQILTQACVPNMKKAGYGRIINIISVSVKQPIMGLGVSNTIRWAVASWAKTLSFEVGKFGITVNNILPGYTLTGRLQEVNQMKATNLGVSVEEIEKQLLKEVPIGRFATPEEVAGAVAFLASPVAASINGINIPVDGGMARSL